MYYCCLWRVMEMMNNAYIIEKWQNKMAFCVFPGMDHFMIRKLWIPLIFLISCAWWLLIFVSQVFFACSLCLIKIIIRVGCCIALVFSWLRLNFNTTSRTLLSIFFLPHCFWKIYPCGEIVPDIGGKFIGSVKICLFRVWAIS